MADEVAASGGLKPQRPIDVKPDLEQAHFTLGL